MLLQTLRYRPAAQYLISLSLIAVTAVVCYFSTPFIGYRVVALLLLLVVSVSAMLFDILPVLLASILSALIWNFFFIPPTFNFHIGTPEDALMFSMYFVVALINAVFTVKIRQLEKKERDKEEREQTIKLYNTVLNSLSHELRTPIATIIGSIDTIKDNSRLSDASREELYRGIEQAGLRLNQQVENLLSMSRLESGTIAPKLDWCDVNELIYTVIEDNREDAKQHTIYFEPNEELPLFKLDQVLIAQAVHNILHNALQHTPAGTQITISAALYEGKCRIVISDNGPGFPKAETEKVFGKFYRLPQATTGGTGLGLSIAKGFVEAHHGTIRLENNEAGGARFILDIPAEASSFNELSHE